MDAGVYIPTVSPRGSWRQKFTFSKSDATPLDFTGCEARAEVRNAPDGDILYLSVNEIPSADGYITIGAEPGVIEVFFSAEGTAALEGVRRASWDLFVEFPSTEDVVKVLKGRIKIDPSVTEPTHD